MKAEKEYDTHEFIKFCNIAGTELSMVPPEDQDTQGEIDKANGVIKSSSKRLRAEKPYLNTETAL